MTRDGFTAVKPLAVNGTPAPELNRDVRRAMNLVSDDKVKRNTELNELLQHSFNPDVAFSITSGVVLQALAELVISHCLQWHESVDRARKNPFIVFRSANAWKLPPTCRMKAWADHCCHLQLENHGDAVKVCEAVSMILRNFSYAGANLRLLSYSPDILHTLIAFLYIGAHDESYRRNAVDASLALNALQTLLNLARYLDVTGQQLLTDKLFYDGRNAAMVAENPAVPNASDFGKCANGEWTGFGVCWLAKRLDTREDTIENVPMELLLCLTEDYLVAVWSIFPALEAILVNNRSTRPVVLMALDLLQEFISMARVGVVGGVQKENTDIMPGQDYKIPTLRSVLVNIPDEMLDRLTELLLIPRHGPDSLDYVDPLQNMVLRVPPHKTSLGYNVSADVDARDRALDVLVTLLELDSPRMAERLGRESSGIRTRLYDALVPILTTTVGRSEASVLAAQLFRELAKATEANQLGLQYIRGRLIELASRDARVSQLVWTHLYPVPLDDGNAKILDPAPG